MSPGDTDDRRGQTPLDFAVAAGIFVVAVVFVVAFIPSLTAPFEGGAGERTVSADRVATRLAEGLLGSRAAPATLDADCTVGFFADEDTACGYDASESLTSQFGLPAFRNVRIELLADLDADDSDEVICYDEDAVQGDAPFVTEGAAACDVTFRAGDEGRSPSMSVSRRSVGIDGFGATMVVRVW